MDSVNAKINADWARKSWKSDSLKSSLYRFFKEAWHVIDPAEFVDGWHLNVICDELERLVKREFRDIVINIPPRHTKSNLISVAFPAWVWTFWPEAQFYYSSYDLRLATRDSVKTRRLVESDWYKGLFSTRLREDRNEKQSFETTAGGHRYITSPSAGATGYGGDFLIADDPNDVMGSESPAARETVKTFWFESMPTRVTNPKTVCRLIVQQRTNEDDLSGNAIRRGYHTLVLPAEFDPDHPLRSPLDQRKEPGELLWPSRFGREEIDRLKTDLGAYAYSGQLQQLPTPRQGGMFQRSDFSIVDAAPVSSNSARAWDLAATEAKMMKSDPDWTVGVKMIRDKAGVFYVADVIRFRASAYKVEERLLNTSSQDGRSVKIRIPQDPGQAGKDQSENYTRLLAGYNVLVDRETGDKVTRARPFAAQCEAGNVKLVKGDWNDEFLKEICGFPNFQHDDQVDAAAGAFRVLVGDASTAMLDYYHELHDEKTNAANEFAKQDEARRNGWNESMGMPASTFLETRVI